MANPAIVEMTRDTGTMARTRYMLDTRSVGILATLNASTKLPHCGSAGHSSPVGKVFDGCSAVTKMLMKGKTVNAISAKRSARPAQSSP
jgi:hypothetical protein